MPALRDCFEKYRYVAVRLAIGSLLFYFFFCRLLYAEEFFFLARGYHSVSSFDLALISWGGILFSALFFLGICTPISALGAFLFLQAADYALPVLRQVEHSYFSLLLLTFALFCRNTKLFSFSECRMVRHWVWRIPIFFAVYLGFSISGWSKVFYEGWFTGYAIEHLCSGSPVAWAIGQNFCSFIPAKALGIGVLLAETLSLPMAIFRRTRPLTWALNTMLHLGALFLVPLAPTSLGILAMQLFLA
ncbi:MAG: hypothetical protein ACXVA8_12865, partial [Bdellovibrionota bacterium]